MAVARAESRGNASPPISLPPTGNCQDWAVAGYAFRASLLILRRLPVNPRLGISGIHPDEMEPRFQGKLAIQLRIANMVILLSRISETSHP